MCFIDEQVAHAYGGDQRAYAEAYLAGRVPQENHQSHAETGLPDAFCPQVARCGQCLLLIEELVGDRLSVSHGFLGQSHFLLAILVDEEEDQTQ